jgi:predicted TIM-barrel enzyme
MPAKPVFRPRPNAIQALFGRRKAVIGVIHSLALPGSPGYDGMTMQEIIDFAVAEATRYRDGGVDGLIVETMAISPSPSPSIWGRKPPPPWR